MAEFTNTDPGLTRRYKNKNTHGGNHAPSVADWFKNDDTLDRQGVAPGKPNGHGICKGTASSWVIAFLNGVREATDAALFEDYYTNFLRYQATMVKDFGKHLDTHASRFGALGVSANITLIKKFVKPRLEVADLPAQGKWGAYMSVWHHDIAIGGTWGREGKTYVVEPNRGLLGYKEGRVAAFLGDLNHYLDTRREGKNKPATDPAGFWMYKPG